MRLDHAGEHRNVAIDLDVGHVLSAERVARFGTDLQLRFRAAQAEDSRVLADEGGRLVARGRRDGAHEVTALARLDADEADGARRRRDADAGLAARVLPEPLEPAGSRLFPFPFSFSAARAAPGPARSRRKASPDSRVPTLRITKPPFEKRTPSAG